MKLICPKNFKSKGFTLIELLVVIGILAILLTIVLVAVNPARQFAQANNTKRKSDVTQILNAIGQYSADNKGNLSALAIPAIPAVAAVIGSDTAGGQVDICADLIPEYISSLPADPDAAQDSFTDTECAAAGGYSTLYTIVQDAGGRITVAAPEGANEASFPETISITR